MEIACPQCGLFRTTAEGVSTEHALFDPCPRCAERAKLLGPGAVQGPEAAAVDPRREWHVMWRGLQRGPYSAPELRALLETHAEGWDAPIWRSGMLNWKPARDVKALLRETMPPPRPSEPPVRQSRVFVVQGAAAGEGARSFASPVLSTADMPALSRANTADVATHAASSLHAAGAAALPASVVDTLDSVPPASFREASLTLRPAPPEVPHDRKARAAGETTLRTEVAGAMSRRRAQQLGAALTGLVLAGLAFVVLRSSAARDVTVPTAAHAAVPAPPVPDVPTSSVAAGGVAASPVRAPVAPAPVVAAPGAPARVAAAPAVPAPVGAALVKSAPAALPVVRAAAAPATPALLPKPERVRIGAAWAPVRASTSPEGNVVCSLPRGTELAVLEQRPGRHRRWFEVHCDANKLGWVHENYVATSRARR